MTKTIYCCVCLTQIRWNLGRCISCFRGMSEESKKQLRTLTRAQRQAAYDATSSHDAPPVHWIYIGNESALIEEDERRVREEKENEARTRKEAAETETLERIKKMAENFTDPSGGSAAMLKIIREATDVSTMTEMLRAQEIQNGHRQYQLKCDQNERKS